MKVTRILFVLILSCLLVFFTGCGQAVNDDDTGAGIESGSGETGDTNESEEDKGSGSKEPTENEKYIAMLADMFVKHGKYSDGAFHITETDVQGDVITVYDFAYYPYTKEFICDCGIYTYYSSQYLEVDYGAWSFSLTENSFYGNHRLENEYTHETISSVEFNYSLPDTSFTDYTYEVTQNTYSNLSQYFKNQYAESCFECVKKAGLYANTIISVYAE